MAKGVEKNMSQYYQYKNQSYRCNKCGWEGLGSEADENDEINSFLALCCPKCYKNIDCISYPTIEESLEYGSDEEKAHAHKKQEFIDHVMAYRLKSSDQLPDIETDKIIISLREDESEAGDDSHIVLYWNSKELWREIRTYEYYDRYLELGKILKEKYGERLIDFEVECSTYLGGDCSFSFDKVREFRKSLSSNKEYTYCKDCPEHTEETKMGYDEGDWFFQVEPLLYCKRAILDGKSKFIGDARGFPKSPDWCPLKNI